jgi:hypothetical protein
VTRFATRATLIGLLLACPAARGQVVAYEGFDYATGQNLQGQAGGSGFAGPWALGLNSNPNTLVAAGSLSAGALATTGNSATATVASFAVNRYQRTLAAPLGADGTTRWLSFVMSRTGIETSAGGIVFGSPAPVIGTAQGLLVGDPSPNDFYSLSRLPSTTTPPTSSSTVPVANRALLVVRMLFAPGDDTFDLFVNPTPGGPVPTTPNATLSFDLGTNNTLVELLAVTNPSGSVTLALDELRFGNTFADVTPVPEPSGLLLGGAAAAGLLAARRRRLSLSGNGRGDGLLHPHGFTPRPR